MRWGVFFLSVSLLPAVAWGERTPREALEEQQDRELWERAGGCAGAARYLEAYPEGLHAGEARECLEAGEEEGLLGECEPYLVAEGAGMYLEADPEELHEGETWECLTAGEVKMLLAECEPYREAEREDGSVAVWDADHVGGYDMRPEPPLEVMALGDAMARAEREAREAEAERLAEAERRDRERAAGRWFRDCPQCPDLVEVPPGSYMMGSPPSEAERSDHEGPRRRVTIGYRFAVGVYEVTFGEWDACVSDGGCRGFRPDDRCWGRGRRPVMNVSWGDAQAYVEWLTRKTGKEYRLLSEAEWEYVARAGTGTARYWGEGGPGQCRYANGADRAAKRYNSESTTVDCDDGHYRTAPVGSYEANGFGLHDVLGNVGEWVGDCWNGRYREAPSDGSAWYSGSCIERVVRGGSWGDGPRYLRSASRSGLIPGYRSYNFGLRVARTLTP